MILVNLLKGSIEKRQKPLLTPCGGYGQCQRSKREQTHHEYRYKAQI